MRLGLSVYGTVYSMGISPDSGRPTIRPTELIDQALAYGLEGVEIPISLLENEDAAAVAKYASERGVFIGLETVGFEPHHLAESIELAARMGVPTLRTIVMGAKLGGDRRALAGRWKSFLDDIHTELRKALEVAEHAGVNLAVENHQDIASEELLWLCESLNSENFGVIFDTGSTLATAEDPVDFARRVEKYIKHVHLKDYSIYLSEEGYRLVRCPLGQGAVNFSELFSIFSKACPNVTMSVEVGALEARHVRMLADDYWPDYPPRTAAQLVKVLRMVQANAKPPGDWRTPYEKGESVEAIMAYENRQLESSLAYIQHALRKYG
ncbi:sugar phosphate isomerase/epimerase family protein [Paenibacillus agricola]|uniref:Sugar phosphate isomerase/epimerase n=1 Tax=Paenibacillus agricola TaxID=2716264 RepID=A0ABX0JL97_9BACL|nr:sugar phosphate isomerase/epimerase [Paenibacillus agricola]NHN34785.1 sugar phosphate isomerase/epimerase [Paenibacillus agricola]